MRKTFKRFSRTILEQGFTAEASVTFDDEASKWVQTKAELTFGGGANEENPCLELKVEGRIEREILIKFLKFVVTVLKTDSKTVEALCEYQEFESNGILD